MSDEPLPYLGHKFVVGRGKLVPPRGGRKGQVLAKRSDSSHDMEWTNGGSGGTVGWHEISRGTFQLDDNTVSQSLVHRPTDVGTLTGP